MAWTLINKVKWAAADPGTSTSIDTTGADLMVLVTSRFNGAVMNPSDSKGNTWHARTEYASTTPCRVLIHYATKFDGGFSVGSSHTFTFSSSGSWFGSAELLAFSGSDFTSSSYDTENGATTASGLTLSTGSITPAASGALLVSGVSTLGSSHSIDNGFTVADSYDYSAGNWIGGGAAYKSHTSGAINPQWSWTTTSDGAATIAAFKGTGTSGASVAASTYYHRLSGSR